jgi:hypothetical protein
MPQSEPKDSNSSRQASRVSAQDRAKVADGIWELLRILVTDYGEKDVVSFGNGWFTELSYLQTFRIH